MGFIPCGTVGFLDVAVPCAERFPRTAAGGAWAAPVLPRQVLRTFSTQRPLMLCVHCGSCAARWYLIIISHPGLQMWFSPVCVSIQLCASDLRPQGKFCALSHADKICEGLLLLWKKVEPWGFLFLVLWLPDKINTQGSSCCSRAYSHSKYKNSINTCFGDTCITDQ